MQKKILILPIQTGYAHIMRSLAVAEELANIYEVTIVIHVKKLHLFQPSKKIKIIISHEDPYDDPNKVLFQYFHKKTAIKLVENILKILKSEKPDLVITDVHPAGMAASWITGIKQVLLINSHIFPYSKGFPGFPESSFWSKSASRPIELFLNFWKRYFIGRVIGLTTYFRVKKINPEEALHTLPIIIPEIKEYNPLRKYSSNMYFVGPIIYEPIEKRDLELERHMEQLSRGKKVIYLTFGGTGFGKKLLVDLIKLLTTEYFVIIASGNILEEDEIIKNKNVFGRKFIPGFSAAKVADIIVSHGSYGTTIQALHWGKPIVAIPFNLDQVYHGLKIQERHIGITLSSVSPHHFFMDFDTQQKIAERFDPMKIYHAIQKVLNKKRYSQNAKSLQPLFQNLDGAKKAVEIIQSFL